MSCRGLVTRALTPDARLLVRLRAAAAKGDKLAREALDELDRLAREARKAIKAAEDEAASAKRA